ncbi:MAG: hypothetical protein ACE5KA_00005 [Nitrososphaerales archaeon]
MKPTKTLAAMSSMLLVLSATIATSAFAIGDLREQVAADTPSVQVQPNRGSSLEHPREGTELTGLVLDVSSQEVKNGNVVILTGKLTDAEGEGVAMARIDIIDHSADSRSSSHDTTFTYNIIAVAVTDAEGLYEASWAPDESRTYDIYGQFGGTKDYLASKSDTMSVDVQ